MENQTVDRPILKFPFFEQPWIAFLLAVAAGSMDGYTFATAKTFATVETGNVVNFGYYLSTGQMDLWAHSAGCILAYGIGSALTALIQRAIKSTNAKRVWSYWILIAEIILLILLGIDAINMKFSPWHIAWLVSFMAGMQGNAFHKIDDMLYGNVAVTAVVQFAFNFLMRGFMGKKGSFRLSGLFFLVLLGLACGGLGGALLYPVLGSKLFWVTAALLILICAFAKAVKYDMPQAQIDEV